jgi:hypothetical protein
VAGTETSAVLSSLGLGYNSQLQEIPSRAITQKTIQDMHSLVKRAKTDYRFIEMISKFLRGVPSKNYLLEAETLFNAFHSLIWKSGFLRYQKDPHQVELVSSIWCILDRRAADCDEMSVLIAAACGSVGMPYRFVCMSNSISDPNTPRHVYSQVEIPRHGWLSMDLTEREASAGWEAPATRRWYYAEPRY